MNKPIVEKERLERELNRALFDLTSDCALSEKLELISSAFYSQFLWMVEADPERTVDNTKVFELREHHISKLFETLNLMVNLTRVHEAYEAVERFTARQKEVNHG